MSEQIKINKIFRDFGITLIDNGVSFTRKAVQNNPLTSISYATIKTNLVNAGISCSTSEMDVMYQTASWALWEETLALVHIILGKIKWTSEVFDCDDFARAKKSFMALLFGMTDMGEVWGKVYNKDTGVLEWYHYFNVIIASDNRVYAHEPITGESVLIIKGKPVVIGDWRYEFLSSRF